MTKSVTAETKKWIVRIALLNGKVDLYMWLLRLNLFLNGYSYRMILPCYWHRFMPLCYFFFVQQIISVNCETIKLNRREFVCCELSDRGTKTNNSARADEIIDFTARMNTLTVVVALKKPFAHKFTSFTLDRNERTDTHKGRYVCSGHWREH